LLRSWLIRGVIVLCLSLAGLGLWLAHNRIHPERVRLALVQVLESELKDVHVEVEKAHLRLFGGISVEKLKLYRHGESMPFFSSDTAILYHDKQLLHRGKLVIRKLEFEQPTLWLHRLANGRWNVDSLFASSGNEEPVPTIVVHQATLLVTDQQPDRLPPTIVDVRRLTVLNDPLSQLRYELQAVARRAGKESGSGLSFTATGRYHRREQQSRLRLEVLPFPWTPMLSQQLAKIQPQLGTFLEGFTGTIAIHADLRMSFSDSPEVSARLTIRDGKFHIPGLPSSLEEIAAEIRWQDRRLLVSQASARVGNAHAELRFRSRPLDRIGWDSNSESLETLQQFLEEFRLDVRQLKIDKGLFEQLPAESGQLWELFQPSGAVDLGVQLTQTPQGWCQELTLMPNRLEIMYERFRYPVKEVTGSIRKITDASGRNEIRIDLNGMAGGRRVEIAGILSGSGPDPAIDLRITGSDVPIDEQLFLALKPKYAQALLKLRASGRGNFVARIQQQHEVNRCENTFEIHFYEGTLNYTHFPYPLTEVEGDIRISVVAIDPTRPLRPGLPLQAEEDEDRIELRNFRGKHGSGMIGLDGEHLPITGTSERRMTLRIWGHSCPLDEDLRTAATALNLGAVWEMLQPEGRLTFAANLEFADRDQGSSSNDSALPFDPVTDLKVAARFAGPSIRPRLFPYVLHDLAGAIRYADGQLDLAELSGQHGRSKLTVAAAEIRFGEDAHVWANIGHIRVHPLIVDQDLLAALPQSVRQTVQEVKLRGPLELVLSHLVVNLPPSPRVVNGAVIQDDVAPPLSVAPTLYWQGELIFAGASFEAGIPWNALHGRFGCTGRFNGNHFGPVLGNLWLDHGEIAKQPLSQVNIRLRVPPQKPDLAKPGEFSPVVLEFPDLSGKLFHGHLGGEARVVMTDPPSYRVWLTASEVRLDELAIHYGLGSQAELRGLAQGKLLLETRPDPLGGPMRLCGAGTLDVPHGRMYNLPVLLPLLKLLKLQAPDQTAFEEAHAVFDLYDNRIVVKQLDLIGTAVSLGGSGELTSDGENVHLEFYTIWSQALKRLLTGPKGGDLTSLLSGTLFKIEMSKQNGGPMEYQPHLLPVVTEPLRQVAERLRERLIRSSNTTSRWKQAMVPADNNSVTVVR